MPLHALLLRRHEAMVVTGGLDWTPVFSAVSASHYQFDQRWLFSCPKGYLVTKVDTQNHPILKWPDDFTIRSVKGVQNAIIQEFGYPKPPSAKTIYRAIDNGSLEAEMKWGAYHFSLRGIARWIRQA